MNLVPYKKIVIQTDLQPPKAMEVLSQAVFTHAPPLLYTVGAMDYYAKISEDRFTAFRLSSYRNDFTAVLHGRFVPTPTGTEVQVKMYPFLINIVFVIVFAGLFLSFFVSAFFKRLTSGGVSSDTLALLAIPVVLYLFVMSSFFSEATQAEIFLKSIYQNETGA